MPRMKFFWAECLGDSNAYDIREKTLKAARDKRGAYLGKPTHGAIYRITLEYDNAFELFDHALGEGGWWGLVVENRLARGEVEVDA